MSVFTAVDDRLAVGLERMTHAAYPHIDALSRIYNPLHIALNDGANLANRRIRCGKHRLDEAGYTSSDPRTPAQISAAQEDCKGFTM